MDRPGETTAAAGGLRRRRPSGEPPPLPHELGRSGRIWLTIAIVYASVTALGIIFYDPLSELLAGNNQAVLSWFTSLRSEPVVDAALTVNVLASRWTIRALRWAILAVLIVTKRWRHAAAFVVATLILEVLVVLMLGVLEQPRPLGVTILGTWSGFSLPSRPLAGLAVSLVAVLYTVLPHGRARDAGKWVTGAVLTVLIGARLILAVEGPTAALFGSVLGVAVGLTCLRLLAPEEVFPVTYRRGKSAHLDVTGRRGDAIRAAVADQLGQTVIDIRPVGLEGSGGSTPLRLTLQGERGPRYVFAKLYAMNHVRADRWYKLGRQILYGALEDERAFGSVRRFVEYEDYALRLLHEGGFPSPEPLGIVEITPEREYLIVMEFFDGAIEIGEARVTERVIDDGIDMVAGLWDAGLAHRDIKPANLMVRADRLLVIDAFFVQVRPSPWRQAVDLANMLLVLALRTDAPTVYERALRRFTPDEIAEGFAATRGVASPSQLRAAIGADGRDLVGEFRSLAPPREPVAIQRWSVRRVALAAWVALLALLGVALVASNWAVFA
jgi:tRNA A-37 threonylcarbamoyl transferase component Bud32